jgi:uncharacterized protein
MASLQLLAALLLALTIESVPNPRDRNSWVSDSAGLISAPVEARINSRLDALERELGVEIAVVAVKDVDSTPKDFATRLFNHWHIGKAQADNGLLVLMVMKKRRLEMETGYGLEPILPDGWLGTMQNEVMVPLFKKGNFAGGIEAGLARIDERLRTRAEEAREGTRRQAAVDAPAAPAPSATTEPPRSNNAGLGGLGVLAVIGGAFGARAYKRKRERTCRSCLIDMRQLSEVEDDAQLDEGQRMEERVRSVDYLVYICGRCQGSRTVAHNRWFSGHSRCLRCAYRTLKSHSNTIVQATYHHGGQVLVTEDCRNCGYHQESMRYTAQLTESSSSSSSSGSSSGGGSSFGGGSSGGGGAGSSW